ncbi:hypothetical protein [Actinoplanes sp. NPDC051494]|uniref:hypothetical protein n=1 Tax=Actinoplanes sp. NPDC051494 TaxID=3363907 RepID=UPI00378C15CF
MAGPPATGPLVTGPLVTRRGPVARFAELRRTTPGRLRLLRAGLIVLALLTGLAGGVTAAASRAGTDDLGNRSQPLLLEAETVWSALADADATAAQAFLTGGLEPAELTTRYDADLERAATALTSAARRAPEDSEAGRAVRELAGGLPRYAELIAGARANNRQGLPVGASYLSAASQLNRDTLQPAAERLLTAAESDVEAGYGDARSSGWTALLTVLLITLLLALLLAQVQLSHRTRRTFNVPLVAATVVTLLLGLTTLGILATQRAHLRAADEDGSRPVALLAQARILVLQQRSDEALTLVARSGTDDRSEARFQDAGKQLATLFARTDADAAVRDAQAAHDTYDTVHSEVRTLDKNGDYDQAVRLAIGADTTATFQDVTDDLGRALEARKEFFAHESDVAGNGLGLLSFLGPLLALAVCALVVTGLRARLEEYH